MPLCVHYNTFPFNSKLTNFEGKRKLLAINGGDSSGFPIVTMSSVLQVFSVIIQNLSRTYQTVWSRSNEVHLSLMVNNINPNYNYTSCKVRYNSFFFFTYINYNKNERMSITDRSSLRLGLLPVAAAFDAAGYRIHTLYEREQRLMLVFL